VELLRCKFTQLYLKEEDSSKRNALLGAASPSHSSSHSASQPPRSPDRAKPSLSTGSSDSATASTSLTLAPESPVPAVTGAGVEGEDHAENGDARDQYLEKVRRRTPRSRKSQLMLMFLDDRQE